MTKLTLSSELSNALCDYKSFQPFIEAYSLWARTQSGVPSQYKCFLNRAASGELAEKEYNDSLPILTEDDAKLIDLAAARVTDQSDYKRKLFNILIISGWVCVDVFFSITYVKKLLRQLHEKFSLLILEAKRRELIEAVRHTLILFEDCKIDFLIKEN